MHEQKEHFIEKQVWRQNPTLMKYFSIAMHLVIGENEIGLLNESILQSPEIAV